MMVDVMKIGKLAKWSLITICPAYFCPDYDDFVKPATAKGVIEHFELKPLQYKPLPAWAFYEEYRAINNDMKSNVAPGLSPSNAAFSGFLMMSMASR